jgi:hypothetical protein
MSKRRDALPFFYKTWANGRLVTTRLDLRNLAFFAIVLTLIALASWLYLRQASDVAAYAHEIRELERDKERLHREITALRAEVAQLGALERVARAGRELGYTLPDAADKTRRVRVEYQPPQPISVTLSAQAEFSVTLGTTLEGPGVRAKGLLDRLIEQLRLWLETPQGVG